MTPTPLSPEDLAVLDRATTLFGRALAGGLGAEGLGDPVVDVLALLRQLGQLLQQLVGGDVRTGGHGDGPVQGLDQGVQVHSAQPCRQGLGGGPAQQVVQDGLLAIFFFVVGLELKRELVVGELSEPRKAKELLGWEPTVSLEDGLAQVAEWLRPRVDADKAARYHR